MNKNQIRELLQNTISVVKFEKTDGTMRTMNCTLMIGLLPDPPAEEGLIPRSKREENDNILAVWDLDIGEWRSFRVSSVKEVSIYYPFDKEGLVYAAPKE